MLPKIDKNNVDLIFLSAILLIVCIGFGIYFAGDYLIENSESRGLPQWLNLSANTSHLLLFYDGSNVAGFKEVVVTGTWKDSRTGDIRVIYETSSSRLKDRMVFPKFITENGIPITIDAKVVSMINDRVQATHYTWGVSADPLSFIGQPNIEFLR